MAEAMTALGDPLLQLRQSIASSTPPILTTSASTDLPTDNLAVATHLSFTQPTTASYPLSTPTRFISSEGPVNLRSIFFAWLHRGDVIQDYIASAQALNEELAALDASADSKVSNLVFVERLDLLTWLDGSADEIEYIKPLDAESAAAQAAGSAQVASGAAGGAAAIPGGAASTKAIDARLQKIYNNERKIADRNTMLRGFNPAVRDLGRTKPVALRPPTRSKLRPELTLCQEFSQVRKEADIYLIPSRQAAKANAPHPALANPNPTKLVSLPSKPGKQQRVNPIILLSPSASSLLRMSNIKSFLSDGVFVPADSSAASAATNMVNITRLLPSIDGARPTRFVLVDSPEQFKPDYWSRVVAVFTTGQAWQFKSYKWQTPQDLFSHVLGIYVGWRDEQVPESVKGWGRGVVSVAVEKWRGEGAPRWRDREVFESLWGRIEESMRRSGWDSSGLAR